MHSFAYFYIVSHSMHRPPPMSRGTSVEWGIFESYHKNMPTPRAKTSGQAAMACARLLKEIWHSFLVGILGTYVEWRIFAPYHKHTLTHTLKAEGERSRTLWRYNL